jgi:hypothetical protein
MVKIIADILQDRVAQLGFFPSDRLAGLVTAFEKPTFTKADNGQNVRTGTLIYPVACGDNPDVESTYQHYEPQSEKGAVAFFVETAAVQFRESVAPKGNELEYAFSLRFLAWMNLKSAGVAQCSYSANIVPVMIKQLYGVHSGDCLNDTPVADWIKQVHVLEVSQMQKTPEIFGNFSFVQLGRERGLFMHPYDYFGLNISGRFILKTGCIDCDTLPNIVPGPIAKRP